MKILVCNQFGIDLIKKFEGFKANPYKCPAGVNTIGYGSTFYPDGSKVKLTDPAITEQKATELLMDLLKPFQRSVDSFCRDDVNSNQFSALCSFCYNVGPNNLKGSTLFFEGKIELPNPPLSDLYNFTLPFEFDIAIFSI